MFEGCCQLSLPAPIRMEPFGLRLVLRPHAMADKAVNSRFVSGDAAFGWKLCR
jgi:hypothetical protein